MKAEVTKLMKKKSKCYAITKADEGRIISEVGDDE